MNMLEGLIPETLANCPQLVCLNFGRNRMSGGLPASLGGCRRLQKLWLNENNFVGPIPVELGKCEELELLNLCGNEGVTGAIPRSLGQCKHLVELQLHGTALSHCPDELLQCAGLVAKGGNVTLPLGNGINHPVGLNAKGSGEVNFWVSSAESPSPVKGNGTGNAFFGQGGGGGGGGARASAVSNVRSGRMAGGSSQ
jgi:hypothetical protein